MGTAATIKQLTWRSYPTPQYKVVLVGLCRFRIEDITKTSPFLVARVTQLDYQSGVYVYTVHVEGGRDRVMRGERGI